MNARISTPAPPADEFSELVEVTHDLLGRHPVGSLALRGTAFPANPEPDDNLLWVGPATITPDGRHVVMLSSRYSRVAMALRSRPEVEWAFTDAAEESHVTFHGTAHVVDSPSAFAKWARLMSAESKDRLLQYPSHTYGFVAVVTDVDELRVEVPSHGIDLRRLADESAFSPAPEASRAGVRAA